MPCPGYDPEVNAGQARDEWMKRTGPFYPLLVAFRLHSNLPLASDLEPSSDDLQRAAPWTIAAGAITGAGLAFVAAILLRTPLVPAISATLLIALWIFASGAFAEKGMLRLLSRTFAGGAAIGSGHLLAAVLLRLGLVIGTAPESWTAALVVSAVAGRLAYLISLRPPWSLLGSAHGGGPAEDAAAQENPLARGLTPFRWAVVAAVVLLTNVALAGGWGMVILSFSAAIGAVGHRFAARSSSAAVVGAAELIALVIVAASSPALVSPLIAGP